MIGDDTVWVHGVAVAIPAGIYQQHGEPRTLIRFAGPIREEWKRALSEQSVKVEFWCPPFGACVTLPDAVPPAELGARFPFIVGAAAYLQEQCTRAIEPHSDEVRARAGVRPDIVDLVCLGSEARARVETELQRLGIPVLASSSSKLRVRYTGDLATLRDLPGVKIADPARGTVPLAATALAVAIAAPGPTGGAAALDGSGEVIAIADTGLDCGADGPAMHRDFQGRIEFLASWPVNPSWNDVVARPGRDDGPADRNSGHGTHVAGLAVGNGGAGDGSCRGVAPAARLVFQGLEQYCDIKPQAQNLVRPGYYLAGRPLDLRQLFQQARDHGARIHLNSWGDPAGGGYTDDCFEADFFLRQNPDAAIFFAAGNDGADRDGDGRLDPGSLYAPAAAKNVIAVGATEGPVYDRGLRVTWSAFDSGYRKFLNFIDRRMQVSGAPDRIAMFSSTGPAADGRTKPDLCAPGTNMAAARSQSCNARAWGLADPLPYYMYDGGTSSAAAVAAGAAALVRQAWRAAGQTPSGAALKAILICGALPVRGRAGYTQALPREAGYGRISVAASLPPRIQLFGEGDPGLTTGDFRDFPIDIPENGRLKAALAWYDAPGERLINDLDLALLAPDGSPIPDHRDAPDRINTVEAISFTGLAEGRYNLRVAGFNIPESPQTFALAVSLGL